jgi:tape measure domain-containing protein
MALVGSLSVSLQAQTQDFDAGMQRARRGMQDVRASVTQVQGTISGLGTALAGLVGGIATIELLRRGITAVVVAGDALQQTQRMFTNLKGSAEAGAESLAFVRQTARQLGQEFGALQQSYIQIAAASKGTVLEGRAADQMFKNVTASMSALGKTSAETDGVFLAFQQAMSKGKLLAQDFNQIAERFPGALGISARALGITTHEFVNMREAGQLMTSDLAKIAQQMYDEIGRKGSEGVTSLAKSWAGLKNSVTELNEALDTFGASATTRWVLDRMADAAKGGKLLVGDAQRALGVGPQAPLAEATALQKQFPGAAITGNPAVAALAATVAERARIAEQLASITALPGAAGSATMQALQKELQDDLERLNYLYSVQYESLRKIGEISQQNAQQAAQASPGVTGPKALEEAAMLQAELAQRISGVTSALATLDRRQLLGADSTEIQKDKVEALNKALLEMQGILARLDKQPLVSMLGGGNLQVPIRGISQEMWHAQIPRIQRIAGQVGVDPVLVAAFMAQESAFNPQATSKVGAQGLMQLMPGTAADYGTPNRYDPEQSIIGGSMYIRDLQRRYPGDLQRQIAGYNAGMNGVAGDRMSHLPAETQDFLKRVQENYAQLRGGVGGAAGGVLGQINDLRRLHDLLVTNQDDRARMITGTEAEAQAFEALGEAMAKAEPRGLMRFQGVGPYGAEHYRALREERAALLAEKEAPMLEELGRVMREPPVAMAERFAAQHAVGRAQMVSTRETRVAPDLLQQLFAEAGLRTAQLPPGANDLQTRKEQEQQILAQAQNIVQLADAMAQERDQLVLTNEELLRQQLTRNQVSKSIADQMVALQRQNTILRDASQVANFVTDSLIDMATGGEVSLARLGQAFGRMALQMMVDASGLRQSLTGLFDQGIQLVISAFSASGGVSSASAAGTAGEGALFGSTLGMASGGDFSVGMPFLAGERGAELIFPRTDGTVLPHAATQAVLDSLSAAGRSTSAGGTRGSGGVTVNGPLMVVQAQDAGSFQRSRGEIEAQGARLLRGMQRGM